MKVFIVLALAAVALADNRPAPTYAPAAPTYAPAAPTYAPAPVRSYKPTPSYNQPRYEDTPANYEYAYNVQDSYNGVDFNANEARNGYATNGAYSVLLPDGRTQTVTYTVADDYSGYVADVQYSGEARYEQPKAYKAAPAPAYNRPAPVYNRPAPAYNA